MVVKGICAVKVPRTPPHLCECETGRGTGGGRPVSGAVHGRDTTRDTTTRRRAMDEATARDVLAAARVLPGPARDARLLALGENAVFAAGDLVVKVGRDAE